MNECEHIELATENPKKATAFYAKLFGWKIDAMPMAGGGEYLMFRTGNGGGGITGKNQPGQTTAWTPYITVASVKASLATAMAAGGAVIMDFMSMGDMGAIAVIADPTGGRIGLYEAGPGRAAAAKPAAKPAAKKPARKKAAPKKAAPKKAAKKAASKKAAKKAAPKKKAPAKKKKK